MTTIGFYGGSKIDGWRTKLGRHLDDFTLVDLMSPEGQLADIALVWAPPKGQLAKDAEFARHHHAGSGCGLYDARSNRTARCSAGAAG